MSLDEGWPSVTAIIPCYNAEKYLEKSLKSVFDQEYPHIEIVAVDDGSSDLTADILLQHSPPVRILRHPNGENRGQGASLNLGVHCSDSELIAFLDADDLWYQKKIKKQVQVFQRHPEVGLVYTNGYYINEQDLPLHPLKSSDFNEINQTGRILLCCYTGPPSAIMVRSSTLDQVGEFRSDLWL